MLLTEINHEKTLDSIRRHAISAEQLLNFNDLKDLRTYIYRLNQKNWRIAHKEYLSDYMRKKYSEDEMYKTYTKQNAKESYRRRVKV